MPRTTPGEKQSGDCKYPGNAPRTGYNKGCRCSRCREVSRIQALKIMNSPLGEAKKALVAVRKTKCYDCGWDKIPAVLEFHHLVLSEDHNPIAYLVRNGSSIERLLRELDKGVFLCPTCHRCRHYNPNTGKVETYNHELR